MIIHNASFLIEKEREAEFVRWIGAEIARLEFGAGEADRSPGSANAVLPRNPRLSAMREAGGVDYHDAEGQSVALQVEFPDIESAKAWSREVFADIAARFEEAFGPQAMVFISLFQELGIRS